MKDSDSSSYSEEERKEAKGLSPFQERGVQDGMVLMPPLEYRSRINEKDSKCGQQICTQPSEKEPDESGDVGDQEEEESQYGGPVFFPRLYIQRYSLVKQILSKFNVKSVMDLGSSECKICRHLVDIDSVERIALVDIDRASLEMNKYVIRPRMCDFLARRKNPLHVQIFEGSGTQLDSRIAGIQAVSMVEIIEHLYPDVLEGVATMVFNDLHPEVIIMTTPNSEYNELFPGLTGFRHWDHKFEWNREQFQTWCGGLAEKYGYEVEYTGVGEPPPGSEHLGQCSQAAVFVKSVQADGSDISNSTPLPPKQTPNECYNLVMESYFPFKKPSSHTSAELLALEVEYQLHQFSKDAHFDDAEGQTLVPVRLLLNAVHIKQPITSDKLREYLLDNGYRLSEDGTTIVLPPLESSSEEDNSVEEEDFDNDTSLTTASIGSESTQK